MNQHHQGFTFPAWDETISAGDIEVGTALTFKLPAGLIYRKVFLYLEVTMVEAGYPGTGDYWLSGDVILSHEGQPRGVLPASIGYNSANLFLPKSIFSLFCSGSGDQAVCVVLGNAFNAGSNNIKLLPCYYTGQVDRFTYNITGWSHRNAANQGWTPGAYRAFGLVLSSNAPF